MVTTLRLLCTAQSSMVWNATEKVDGDFKKITGQDHRKPPTKTKARVRFLARSHLGLLKSVITDFKLNVQQ